MNVVSEPDQCFISETGMNKIARHAFGVFAAISEALDSTSLSVILLTLQCSFPGPPSIPSLAVRKSGRGPGIICHVSDIEVERRVERT